MPSYRNTQDPSPHDLTPSADEAAYLAVLNQIQLRQLELTRLDIRKSELINQIRALEASADFARDTAVGS
jgi:hypothetical protein